MRVLSLLSALPLAIVAVPSMPSKFILGVWLDTDTPAGFNAKMGRKMPSFEAAVSIPYAVVNGTVQLDPLPGQDARYLSNAFSWNDNSDASLFMTVYADQTNGNQQGMDLVTDDAITHLANRLHSVQQMGRQVYMRWLPEMSGAWMLYGQQPDAYVALWNRMGAIFRQVAPEVMLVWSPNYDTRDNSYWPGPQYVDWIGSSCYWKGWGVNGLIDQSYAMDTVSFIYQNYAAVYNLPFVISEASGSWESGPGVSPVTGESFTSVTNQVDQATFQTSFWSGILAPEVMAQYPLLKAAYIFEVAKTEEFFSDFRVSNDSATLAAFKALVATSDSAGLMQWASPSTFKPNTTSTSTAVSSPSSLGASSPTAITASALPVSMSVSTGSSPPTSRSSAVSLASGILAGWVSMAIAVVALV